jgi:hypothetical protein
MDFVDGRDAAHLLADRFPGGMPVDQVVHIVTAVASALDYAHKQGCCTVTSSLRTAAPPNPINFRVR